MTRTSDGLRWHRPYWRWSAAAQLARLPAAMAPLAFTVLTTTTTGSYRLGGILMSVYVVAELLGAVPAGRLLDRIGPAKGLVRLLVCAAAGFGVLTVALALGVSGTASLVLVVVPGVVTGGLSGGLRTLLAGSVFGELLSRAVALDAVILEGVLILGPVLVPLFATVDSLAPLVAMAVAYLGSAMLVPRRSVSSETVPPDDRRPVPFRTATAWLACQFAVGHVLSTVEVSSLPLVQRLGTGQGAAALVIAVLCAASILGGALYAWQGSRIGAARRQATGLLCGFVLGATVLAFGAGWPGLIAGIVAIGLCTSPLVTIASVRLQRLLPQERRSEGFSASFVVQSTGFGLGSLSVGILPLPLAYLLGALSAGLACLLLPCGTGNWLAQRQQPRSLGAADPTGETDDRSPADTERCQRG